MEADVDPSGLKWFQSGSFMVVFGKYPLNLNVFILQNCEITAGLHPHRGESALIITSILDPPKSV